MNNVTEQEATDTILKTTVENPVIDISQLKKSFGSQEILKDITL